jgi:hypothetical protein
VLTVNGGRTRFGTLSVFSNVTVDPVVLVTIWPDVIIWAFARSENAANKQVSSQSPKNLCFDVVIRLSFIRPSRAATVEP